MSKELANIFSGGLSTKNAAALKAVAGMSGPDFLGRIQLYSDNSDACKLNLIQKGHFGIPLGGDKIHDLGVSIDLYLVAIKAKAVDLSDLDNIIESVDPESKEYRRIVETADDKTLSDTGCMYGPAYLVFERTTGKFYEYFCGSKSARYASGEFNHYLDKATRLALEMDVKDNEPDGPRPITLTAELIKRGKYIWHVPKTSDCVVEFTKLPTKEDKDKEERRFFAPPQATAETVEAPQGRKSR